MIQKIENLKKKIEKEITLIDKSYDKINNEITKVYEVKHEKLLTEEKNLKENLQNEVTKTKEKFEEFLSNCNKLLNINERINKGVKIFQNEKEKSIIKTLSYISNISKTEKEINLLLGKLMKNININFNENECKLKFEDYYFSGIQIPQNIECKDITSNNLKLFWKIDNIKIENVDNDKIKFRVEIKKENSNESFKKVYEDKDSNCSIENLYRNTYYEIRICSIYNDIIGEWNKIEKVKTDFINESVILNQDDKNKLLNWLNPLYKGKNLYLKLLYRRGNDMSFETFHLKCDNKGPTLVVCQSKNEKFGGYTKFNYYNNTSIKHEEGPFIFSLNKNKKYNYTNKKYNSFYTYKNHGPDFYWDFAFNSQDKKMKVCFCTTNKYGFAFSNEPINGDGSYKEIEVDEVEVFKVKSN